MRSSGSGAGPDDRRRGLGSIGEDGGRVSLELAVRAFGGEDAPFGDRQVEALDRAAAAGNFRDRRNRVQAVAALLLFLHFHGGDDRPGYRRREVGVDVEGRRAAAEAAVEDEQLTVDVDRPLFGEFDLDGRLAGADDRALAGFFSRFRVAGLQLPGLALGQAFDVDGAVLVGFEDDFFQRRRMGAVFGRDLSGSRELDRSQFVFRQLGRLEFAVDGHDQVAGFDRHRFGA